MKVEFFEKHLNVKTSITGVNFSEVSTDTRSIKKGALFIALKGPSFNANEFALKALELGASACVVDDKSMADEAKNIYLVEDTKVFLKEFSKAWVESLNPVVIGVTGSNGKTTTKVFIAQVLNDFFPLHFSPKSFNNDIGVPLTQLGLKEEDEILICEIGTNAPGEIEDLTKQAPADISMVTTVGPSHLDKLKNLEGVANEKKQIYIHSKKKTAIFNLDNEFTKKMYEKLKGEFKRSITVSCSDESADVYVNVLKESVTGLKLKGRVLNFDFELKTPVFGAYNVYNIMFALASGLSLEVEASQLVEKLKTLKTPWGRSQILKDSADRTFVFDGYNSNLQSMTSLLSSLKCEDPKKLHIVLGDMLELGEESESHHFELGKIAGTLNPKSVTFLGSFGDSFFKGLELSKFKENSIISSTYDKSLALKLQSMLDEGDVVVLKASRGTRIEQFLTDLGVKFDPL